jgi:hypothetical protein
MLQPRFHYLCRFLAAPRRELGQIILPVYTQARPSSSTPMLLMACHRCPAGCQPTARRGPAGLGPGQVLRLQRTMRSRMAISQGTNTVPYKVSTQR